MPTAEIWQSPRSTQSSRLRAARRTVSAIFLISLTQNLCIVHENSVDAICANPQTDKEFATASHDHTIKLWDAPKYGVKGTIKGHEKGVWALEYDEAGKRLISASPDKTSKVWDVKSGKCVQSLNAHTRFVSK